MKKISIIVALALLALITKAQEITAFITVTNPAGTTNGQTITVNGGVRTWTNNFSYPPIQIPMATNQLLSASNLAIDFAMYPAASVSTIWNKTNTVIMSSRFGANLSVSISSGWGTLTTTTNGTANSSFVRVPPSSYDLYGQTNILNGLCAWLSLVTVTTPISASAPAFANFVQFANVTALTNLVYTIGQNDTNFALLMGLQATNYANVVGQALTNRVNTLDSEMTSVQALASVAQPGCPVLSNLCAIGTVDGLSYIAAGTGNIQLKNTNGTVRLEADLLGNFTLNFEDGVNFFMADTSHDIWFYDHAGHSRLEIGDASDNFGWTVIRGNNNTDAIVIPGGSDAVRTWKPVSFNVSTWPATATGTTTNYVGQAQNSGTSATTTDNYNVPANCLTNNGDTIYRTIGVSVSTGTSSKREEVYFAGTQIFDTGAIANTGAGSVSIVCEITRIDSATVGYNCHGIGTATATTQWAKVGTIGGLDFTTAQNCYLILTASGTGAASSQITVVTDNSRLAPSSVWAGMQ